MSSDSGPELLFRARTGSLSRRGLQRYAERLTREVTKGRPFGCLIAGDDELRRLNREFRRKDRATDVLSFAGPTDGEWLGEMAISIDRAREQARDLGHRLSQEIGILMLHGVLHLVGMDHERDRGEMARAESRWRKRLGLPDGLIERVRA